MEASGRCVTECVAEDKINIRNVWASSLLSSHLQEGNGYSPICYQCTFLNVDKDKEKILAKEAGRIGLADNCISSASLTSSRLAKQFSKTTADFPKLDPA